VVVSYQQVVQLWYSEGRRCRGWTRHEGIRLQTLCVCPRRMPASRAPRPLKVRALFFFKLWEPITQGPDIVSNKNGVFNRVAMKSYRLAKLIFHKLPFGVTQLCLVVAIRLLSVTACVLQRLCVWW
jgi:hypothetical protein